MRILFVGMAESIHVARWVNQLQGTGWERFLFPVYSPKPHPELRDLTFINRGGIPGFQSNRSLRYMHRFLPYSAINLVSKSIRSLLRPSDPVNWPSLFMAQMLARAIKHIKPDIIHSMEFQGAGYLTLEARSGFRGNFPKWIATNWGNDIYLFGRLAEHRDRVHAVLEHCDYYSCECERDVVLAQEYGLRGEVLPVFPNTGGFDLPACELLKQPGNTSERKLILLKGYQGWAGRALVGLQALARCKDIIKEKNYSIGVYSATPDVKIAAELLSAEIGIPIEILPSCSHDEMLKRHGRARIYIGLSISDGVSTSLLEAMVMGAFPVQSCTACADEWIRDGKSGFIVPGENVELTEVALRRALTDDELVDQAASLNLETARKRLSSTIIQPKVIDFYQHVYDANRKK